MNKIAQKVISLERKQTISVPYPFKFLRVLQVEDNFVLYFQHDRWNNEEKPITLKVYGTNDVIDPELTYIDSIAHNNIVYHFYGDFRVQTMYDV